MIVSGRGATSDDGQECNACIGGVGVRLWTLGTSGCRGPSVEGVKSAEYMYTVTELGCICVVMKSRIQFR